MQLGVLYSSDIGSKTEPALMHNSIEDIIFAVQAASAIGEYELAATLLKDAGQDGCIYCGKTGHPDHMLIWCCTPTAMIEGSMYAPTEYAKAHLLGWVHFNNQIDYPLGAWRTCATSMKRFRHNRICNAH